MAVRPSQYKNYVSQLNALLKSSDARRGRLALLYGSSDFLVARSSESVAEHLCKKSGATKTTLHLSDVNDDSIEQIITPSSLFESRACYLIQCHEQPANILKLLKEIESVDQLASDLVIGFYGKSLGAPISKQLKRLEITAINCVDPRFKELDSFVHSLARKQSLNLSPSAVSFFLAHVGNDLFRLENELKKLATIFSDTSGEEINPNQIAPYLGVIKEDHAFSIDSFLLDAKYSNAEALITDLLARGESPLAINALIARYSRCCIKVKDAVKLSANPKQLAEKTGMHPGIVWRFADHVKKHKEINFHRIIEACQTADLDLKSSGVSAQMIMANLMVEIRDA